VANLGDISEVDWAAVEPIDILCGGFPCTDVSTAGQRAGLTRDTRSGLWFQMAKAVEVLRPQFVFIENVKGLLSAKAIRNLESGDDALGVAGDGPLLRAIGAVCGDLADRGYDTQWTSLRASDVGAAHRRERVFILAHRADTDSEGRQGRGEQAGPAARRSTENGGGQHPARHGEGAAADTEGGRLEGLDDSAGGEAARDGWQRIVAGSPGSAAVSGTLLPTPRASDGDKGGPNQRGSSGDLMLPSAVQTFLPTPRTTDSHGPGEHGRGGIDLRTAVDLLPTPAAAESTGGGQHPDKRIGHTHQLIDYALMHGTPRWGTYEPAIRRQESFTRPAPSPTEPNTKGNLRLSAKFSEWLMMWPPGWVTDPELKLSRNAQLKLVGNGVVPHQAIAAFTYLFTLIDKGP
jgi:DNA (cytosine-5)-methyltransferase 1